MPVITPAATTADPELAPDPSPAAGLIRALDELARAQRESAVRIARDLDIPRSSFGLLRMLQRCGPVQLGDIAAKLRVDLSVASRQVSHLVDEGLVRRTVDDDDRRARTVELTDAGRGLVLRAYEHIDSLAATTFAEWRDEEIVEATRQIERVASAVVAGHAAPRTTG
ncbi:MULTISPECIES: MarR family winged helix-turn-helix transcriptional regulator [Cellulosimicrobium]|uniref:MarR family winged helix-turn-helix transcriptional regulator n=1 Tax=Cellulosimicrobium TaxID=157920 RepID=UPI002097EFDE|nr:MarR family winged helix-turn-helix transcriptional regulator [Cellulosimicrobium cellulans]MCO7275439.1 MarR family winged helix-turn-helix transcriptional regulator [Cellulosimicrobium cellulans]